MEKAINIPVRSIVTADGRSFSLPVLGFGTWYLGGTKQRNPDNDDERDRESIRNALKLGITHIDTAEIYAEGYTERLIGEVIREFPRSSLLLASKVNRINFASEERVFNSGRESVRRLGVEQLDLYAPHSVPAPEEFDGVFKALNRLKADGLVAELGVCNFDVSTLQRAQDLTRGAIRTVQVHYNLKYRQVEREKLLEYCQRHNILLIAWRALQLGTFSKASPPILADIASRHNATPNQIALSWVISQENCTAIFMTKNPDHLKENLGALRIQLSNEEIEALRDNYPDQEAISWVPLGKVLND